MTCIAAITDGITVWMGGDSAGVSGTSLLVRADAKVFASGPYVTGFTTSFRMGQLLRYTFSPPAPAAGVDLHAHMCTAFVDSLRECLKAGGWATRKDDQESGGNFIVGVRGRLFEVFSDYSVGERVGPYAATGCGEDLAMGSFHATEALGLAPEFRVRRALEGAALNRCLPAIPGDARAAGWGGRGLSRARHPSHQRV